MPNAQTTSTVLCAFGVFGASLLSGCSSKPPARPRLPAAASSTIDVTRADQALRGVASDGSFTVTAFAPSAANGPSIVEARTTDKVAWSTPLPGATGEVELLPRIVAVALSTTGALALAKPLEVRGDPGSVLVGLDRTTGAQSWQLAFDSTEWALVTSLAPLGDDLVVGGTFAGTLRIGNKVISTAGGSDGFVARVTSTGQLTWIIRAGGQLADGVQGVATQGDTIAIAGTFSPTADLLGAPLPSIDERVPFGDAFVATLDGTGKRRWSSTFGSRADDAVAGVTIDEAGHIVVAASVHEVVSVGGDALVPRGSSDGLVVWYRDSGELANGVLIGGNDYDGLRGITSFGERVVVGGFFSGKIELGDTSYEAGGGDDSFLAALDANGTITSTWHVGGAGREEITTLGPIPGGFVAGVAHTATLQIGDEMLPAPADPMTGAALVVRGL